MGYLRCSLCQGTEKVECFRCNGTGNNDNYDSSDESLCRGSGELPCPKYPPKLKKDPESLTH
jgi:hypothetical protein